MIKASTLASFIESRRATPFAWGTHDCATFAADACVAIYGVDPFEAYRGTYATAEEALRLFPDLVATAGEIMQAAGFVEISPVFARTGDIVVVMNAERACCGVHLGDVVAAPGAEGLVFLKTETLKSWRKE